MVLENQRNLKDRTDAAVLLLDIIRPLKPYYSPGRAWLCLGSSAAHYGEKAARMEGFARILWGLGPLWSGDNRSLPAAYQEECEEWRSLYLEGIIHGTDPEHPEYWGDLVDFDQKMVEMAALAVSVCLAPDKLWNPLSGRQQEAVYRWFCQINEHQVHPNNWRFFRILVNMMFCILGRPWSGERMAEDMAVIENCYIHDGWYFDGQPGQMDYYIPFAIQFYSLIYAHFMKDEDPAVSKQFKERADRFSRDFIYWFSQDGNELPFGRSLTYRFAHTAFFTAMGLANVPGPGYGVMRGIVLENLKRWLERPVFDNAGILTVGYGYPNLFMSERYNAPGSPYWGLKTFLILALPDNHPFWTDPDKKPVYQPQKLLAKPHMLVTHDKNGHVMAFTAGQRGKCFGASREKYEKFVYSNQFAFSVSRGMSLEEGAYDNTLAVSVGESGQFQMRDKVEKFSLTETAVYVSYTFWGGVQAESLIIPCAPWHIRIHRIRTRTAIETADGGFAIEAERCFEAVPGRKSGKYEPEMVRYEKHGVFAEFPWGVSGAVSCSGGEGELVSAFPNTNLLYNLTVIPTIRHRLAPGEHLLASCILGDRSKDAARWGREVPEVTVNGERIQIRFQGKNRMLSWTEYR